MEGPMWAYEKTLFGWEKLGLRCGEEWIDSSDMFSST